MLSPMVGYLNIPITLCRRVESHSYFADKCTKGRKVEWQDKAHSCLNFNPEKELCTLEYLNQLFHIFETCWPFGQELVPGQRRETVQGLWGKTKTPQASNTNQKSRVSWRPREASVPGACGVPDKGGWGKAERKVKPRSHRASLERHMDLIWDVMWRF